jgi:predicted CXXCH cytochrome family protein
MNFGFLFLMLAQSTPAAESISTLENQTNDFAAYAGSASCRDCHRPEYDLWAQSHHGLAERPLRPEDKTAFNPTRDFKQDFLTNTLRLQNGIYQIVTLGFKTNIEPYRVERVIGHDPVEQFLTAADNGRWQVQEISYNPNSNHWFDVYGNENRQPGEWGHWTGRGMNWNSQCAECHNTDLKKNYDAVTDRYHTTMAEMSVGCEACHGPLKTHVEWQYAHPHTSLHDPTIKQFNPTQIVDTCGSCHSRTTDLTGNFHPGDAFSDHYALEILDNGKRWYPDGQVKDEDYEFVSFLSSKMHQAGVTCLDCHNPHSAKNTLQGNDLCMRCHTGGYPKAPVINLAEHTHHASASTGNLCINCHMPVTVYMQEHPRRDHGFTIPDPLLTKQLNIPNACNRCHTDQSTDWALKYTEQWYGAKMNRPTRDRAEWIAAAENGEIDAKDHLISLLADTNQIPYWKAAAINFLGYWWAADPAATTALLAQLKADQPLVRESAVRFLEPVVNQADVQLALQPMLNDPSRNVRVAAAWVLRTTVDLNSQANRELQAMLDYDADQPDGQYQEAILLLSRQQPKEALAHLQKATAWDPLSPPFLCTQAQVQDQLGQTIAALKTLDQAATAVSDDPYIPYVRATILLRNGKKEEAKVAIKQALKIKPDFQPAKTLLQKISGNN